MRLLLLTRYGRLGASSRLRAFQYLPYLEERGFEITTFSFFPDTHQEELYAGRSHPWSSVIKAYVLRLWRLLRAAAFDVVWIEYELFPWLPALAERILTRLGIPYVVDYDDPIFHRYDLHINPLVRRLLGKKVDVIMRRAHTVIVGNDYLGERARLAGARRIESLPTVVDVDRYRTSSTRKDDLFTIGWIGSGSTVKYLSLIAPVLADFCQSDRARVVVVGARDVALRGVPVETKPWSEGTEVDDILTFDVGIMPLPDEPWERGKCGYKLIQYMASARPVIASPVGANSQIVESGVNGFLAKTDEEWTAALHTLSKGPELRRRFGEAGRRKVEAEYCTRVTAPRLAAILGAACPGNDAP